MGSPASPPDRSACPSRPRPERTFAQNALLKARAAAEASGLAALADDSGLSVAALDGRPGVYTADWAERQWFEGPPGRDWYMAMGKVEGMLAERGAERRPCRRLPLRAGAGLARRRTCHLRGHAATGRLTWPPRGTLGFGYDPVFVPHRQHDSTFAEISRRKQKHAISHRADAFARLVAEQFG
ncbi:MAG: hypothetical protein KatS3mg120_0063 [Erythrobacter sp.]|nr:MAG: hypothetical protein KatS3mg120_0063 [Erythrobacter sp.]